MFSVAVINLMRSYYDNLLIVVRGQSGRLKRGCEITYQTISGMLPKARPPPGKSDHNVVCLLLTLWTGVMSIVCKFNEKKLRCSDHRPKISG